MHTTINQFIRQVMGKLTPLELAARELAEAEQAKLQSETAMEYAIAMVEYNNSRILRLRHYLSSQAKPESFGSSLSGEVPLS